MPPWVRKIGVALLLAFAVAYAYAPVVGLGLTGRDFAVLADVERIARPQRMGLEEAELADLYRVDEGGSRPLASLSLAVSSLLWQTDAGWRGTRAIGLRLEQLALLAAGAVALAFFVRRALWPWVGREQARAAGWASACLLSVHPLCLPLVASPARRGDLLALVLCTLCGAVFLRSRQEGHPRLTLAAGALAILAGFTSELALLLPLALCSAEFFSGRRHRQLHVRLRTTTTTLLVFAACLLVETLARFSITSEWHWPNALASLEELGAGGSKAESAGLMLEKLGLLILPVNAEAQGILGFTVAGLAFLACLQPALLAARTAPRLWGWFHLGWLISLLVGLAPHALVGVSATRLTHAALLFAAVIVMCIGLGVTATAVSGLRRSFLPALAALGYAALAHTAARPWQVSAHALSELGQQLTSARSEYPGTARYLVVDPPGPQAGLDLVEPALPWLLHPLFTGGEALDGWPLSGGLSRPALLALAREPEFDALRSEGLVLLIPGQLLPAHSAAAEVDDPRLPPSLDGDSGGDSGGGAGDDYVALALPVPEPSSGPRIWRAEGRSPVLDLDPLRERHLRVEAHPGTDTSRPPRLAWRAKSPLSEQGRYEGVWISGRDGPVALFDLGSHLPWLIGGRVRRIWFPGRLATLVKAEVQVDVPGEKTLELEREGQEDWSIDPGQHSALDVIADSGEPAQASWRAAVLDLSSFAYESLEVLTLVGREQSGSDLLSVPAAGRIRDERQRSAGGPLVFVLEYVARDTILVRLSGRLADFGGGNGGLNDGDYDNRDLDNGPAGGR